MKAKALNRSMTSYALVLAGALVFASAPVPAQQHRPMDAAEPSSTPPARQHLILKDGTYQLVLGYQVVGNIVRYRSAERNGETEDIPLELVDLAATRAWAAAHAPGQAAKPAPVLSPELAREEADRAARTPVVAPDLRLPEEDSLLVLDTYAGTPELVPLAQEGGDLNHETAHNVLKGTINPASSPHRILEIPGEKADVQLHVADPVFYARIGPDDGEGTSSGAITVDTGGASGRATPGGGAASSGYVLERLDVRRDSRVVDSFRIAQLGVKAQPDIIEMKQEEIPGGHWLKLTPQRPMEFGEYALIEVLSDRDVNLGLWDFGVHPTAKENVEAIRPEPKRPVRLERR